MKKRSLLLVLFSFCICTFCNAHFSQGFESFFHDANPVSPMTNNRCFTYINHLFTHPIINPYLHLPNSTYEWYTSDLIVPARAQNYWNQTFVGNVLIPLTLQQQATLTIRRFCIGITNHRNVLAFQNLQNLWNAYQGMNQGALVNNALIRGGYDSPAARFLHNLFAQGESHKG